MATLFEAQDMVVSGADMSTQGINTLNEVEEGINTAALRLEGLATRLAGISVDPIKSIRNALPGHLNNTAGKLTAAADMYNNAVANGTDSRGQQAVTEMRGAVSVLRGEAPDGQHALHSFAHAEQDVEKLEELLTEADKISRRLADLARAAIDETVQARDLAQDSTANAHKAAFQM